MKKRGVVIILAVTLFAIIFYGYRYVMNPVDVKIAKMVKKEDVIKTDAYVVRNEVVYSTLKSGTLYSYVQEGARVGKNRKIATVYSSESNGELIQELNNIDLKIEQLETEKKNKEKYTAISSSMENTIENIKNDIIVATIENEVDKIAEYKRTINSFYNSDGYNDATLLELKKRKIQIEDVLSRDRADIVSTISGVYSKNVDGLENVLTPDVTSFYSVFDFNNIGKVETNQKTTSDVYSGEDVCKVVDNHTWYVMCVVPKEKAETIKKIKNVKIRFNSLPGTEVSAEAIYVSNEDENEPNRVIALKSDRYIDGVYGIRNSEIDIVLSSYKGFEIPSYALRNVGDEQGVMISKGLSEIFCKCDIIYQSETNEKIIIIPSDDAKNKLEIGDEIIIGEKTEKN